MLISQHLHTQVGLHLNNNFSLLICFSSGELQVEKVTSIKEKVLILEGNPNHCCIVRMPNFCGVCGWYPNVNEFMHFSIFYGPDRLNYVPAGGLGGFSGGVKLWNMHFWRGEIFIFLVHGEGTFSYNYTLMQNFHCISSHWRRLIWNFFPGEHAPGPPIYLTN